MHGVIVESATTQFLLDEIEIDCDECACCRAPSAVYSSTEYRVCARMCVILFDLTPISTPYVKQAKKRPDE